MCTPWLGAIIGVGVGVGQPAHAVGEGAGRVDHHARAAGEARVPVSTSRGDDAIDRAGVRGRAPVDRARS